MNSRHILVFDVERLAFFFSVSVRGQQAVPHLSPLQHPQGHDQGGDAPSRLHGAQARVQGTAHVEEDVF
jgi:hypothetical protein